MGGLSYLLPDSVMKSGHSAKAILLQCFRTILLSLPKQSFEKIFIKNLII